MHQTTIDIIDLAIECCLNDMREEQKHLEFHEKQAEKAQERLAAANANQYSLHRTRRTLLNLEE